MRQKRRNFGANHQQARLRRHRRGCEGGKSPKLSPPPRRPPLYNRSGHHQLRSGRVFTNRVVWDEEVHGKLYADRWDVKRSNCAYAELATWGERPWLEIWTKSCYQDSYRFLCLKPSTALKANAKSDTCSFKLQAIKSNNELNFASAAIIGFCGVASVFFAFVAVKYYRKYRSIKEK